MSRNQPVTPVRPFVSVDIAIFTVADGQLQTLLVQRQAHAQEPFPGRWALPGGFVDTQRDPSLEACARRTLLEKTAIDAPYLEQLGSWGSADRDPRGWSTTHVYFALLPHAALAPVPGRNATDAHWRPVSQAPFGLAFDHDEILVSAVRRLRAKVEYTSLPLYLTAPEFTLTEAQEMYEIILGRTLEKKAFRTRLLSADLLQPLSRQRTGANRPAQLFRLRPKKGLHFFARPFGSAEPP